MITIYKYSFETEDRFELTMPAGSKILTVDTQGDSPAMWVLADTEAESQVTRRFAVFRTGGVSHREDIRKMTFIGTYLTLSGREVYHVFEVINGE